MQITVNLTDGTASTLDVDDVSGTVAVTWQTKSQDGYSTSAFNESFAAAEVASVTFTAGPAPAVGDSAADPAPVEDAAPVADAPAEPAPDAAAPDAAPDAAPAEDAAPADDAAAAPADASASTDIAAAEADLADAAQKLDSPPAA